MGTWRAGSTQTVEITAELRSTDFKSMEATWKSYELPGPLQAEIYISCRNSAAGKLLCFPLFHCGLLFYWKFVESNAHLHNISVSKMLFLFGRMFWLKNPNCVKQVYLGLCNVAWTLYICGDIKAEEATSFFISAKVIFSKKSTPWKGHGQQAFPIQFFSCWCLSFTSIPPLTTATPRVREDESEALDHYVF